MLSPDVVGWFETLPGNSVDFFDPLVLKIFWCRLIFIQNQSAKTNEPRL